MFFKSKRDKTTIFAIYFLFCSSLLAFSVIRVRARSFVSVYASKDFFQLALYLLHFSEMLLNGGVPVFPSCKHILIFTLITKLLIF